MTNDDEEEFDVEEVKFTIKDFNGNCWECTGEEGENLMQAGIKSGKLDLTFEV